MSRAPRTNVDMPALMIAPDGLESQVKIKDLSAAGLRMEHSDDLHEGDLVTLVLAKGERLRVRIQWSLGREAGGHFLDPPQAQT